MQKALVVSILVGNNFLQVDATQRIEGVAVGIHSQYQEFINLFQGQQFLQEAISLIEQKVQRKVKEVNLIFDDFSLKNLGIETKICNKTFLWSKDSTMVLNEQNYWDFHNFMEKELANQMQEVGKKVLNLMPLKFVLQDPQTNQNQTFAEFPHGKVVKQISCVFSALTLPQKFYDQVQQLFSNLDLKFKTTLVASQLSLYQFQGVISNKLTFTINIKAKKTLLTTAINQVVVSRDELKFSYEDLVEKISKSFDLSGMIANNLVQRYGLVYSNNLAELSEIIYMSNEDNALTKRDLQNVIKSFLKTLSMEVKDLISRKLNNHGRHFDINIIGQLENIANIDLYCRKYLQAKNVVGNLKNATSFTNWNPTYQIHLALVKYLKIINDKIQPLMPVVLPLVNQPQPVAALDNIGEQPAANLVVLA